MNLPPIRSTRDSASYGEETLRLIARLPAPDGLEDRVLRRLDQVPRTARILTWKLNSRWIHSRIARGAAAAAIVCIVTGGGWEVYSRVAPPPAAKAVAMPPVVAPRGFSSANAVRTPNTLNGPTLTHPEAAPRRLHGARNRRAGAANKSRRTQTTDGVQTGPH
jgi:hypothetical protein